ncbi:hypothetical protein ENBRE01_2806 [Enteropsectra breve]|nr:hypothetical protein ENBRE01_2806 [Enteropsectra breve]
MQFKKLSQEQIQRIVEEIEEKLRPQCPKCKTIITKLKKSSCKVVCPLKMCRHRFNKWEGTFFKGLRDKCKILQVLELWMLSFKIRHISYMLDISRTSIWKILKYLDSQVENINEKMIQKIGGKDVIVEIDESKFGKRKYNKGHKVEGVWVFGMVERIAERKVIMFAVNDRSAKTLEDKMKKHVESNSVVYSDCWKGYNKLCDYFHQHLTVNHSKFYKDIDTGVHTNTIEGCWAGVKVNIPYKNRTKKKINIYLMKFMLTRNEKSHPLISLIKYLF